MDPFFAKNRLSDYLDGQLSDEEAAEVRRALEEDTALREDFESLSATVSLLRKHGPTTAPDGFHERVMAQVSAQPTGRLVVLRNFFRQVPVEAIALAAAAVLVIVIVGNPGNDIAGPALSPPPVEVKGGAAAPQARIMPSQDLELPLGLSEPVAAPATSTAPPRPEVVSKPKTLQKVAVEPPPEAYVAEWEQQDTTDAYAAGEKSPGSATAETDDVPDTPRELFGGLSAETATPYQYRITLGDAQVLYSLEQLAQRTSGRLLDSSGSPLSAHPLNVEENFMRVQLVVPPGQADTVHEWLKSLGAKASLPESSSPLYGADDVAFFIEVSYLP